MTEPHDRMRQKTVSVFTAQDEMEAGLVKQLLESCGIACVVHGRITAGLYPVSIGGLGKREIFVLEDDAEDARLVLADWHKAEPEEGEEEG